MNKQTECLFIQGWIFSLNHKYTGIILDALQITLLTFKTDYFNPKYVKALNVTMRRTWLY